LNNDNIIQNELYNKIININNNLVAVNYRLHIDFVICTSAQKKRKENKREEDGIDLLYVATNVEGK
jgi:hypothetical protein